MTLIDMIYFYEYFAIQRKVSETFDKQEVVRQLSSLSYNAFRRNENVDFSFQEWNLSKISGFFPRTIKEVKNYKFNLCIYLMELFVIHVSFKPSNGTYRIQNSEIKVKSLSLHFTFISNIVTVTVYWRKNYLWLICFLGPFFSAVTSRTLED